jgi:ribosomal protein S18 acetylase RimI-like enzyme
MADTSPTYRYAAQPDAARLHALIERAYRGPENEGGWNSESHLLRGPRTSVPELIQLISRDDSRFVLAEDSERRLLACALLQRVGTTECTAGDVGKTGAYFGMFAVDPSLRSNGIGKVMLAECERRAVELWGSAVMVMTVISVRDALIDWYGRRGYQATGARIPFPFSDSSGETTRDFDLVELRKALA